MGRDVLGGKPCRAFSLFLLLALIAGLTITHGSLWASEPTPGSHRRMTSSLSDQGENEAAEKGDEDDFMEDLLGESSGADNTATAPAGDRKNFPLAYEGELVAHLWSPNDYDHDWHTTDRLDLKGWGDIGAIRMAGRFRLDYQDLEKDAKARNDLRELYATYQLRPTANSYADLTIGKKILYWGKGDEVRPIDRVCPEDLNALYFYNLNDRMTLFGADVERTLSAVVLRAEAAYQSRGAWFALDWQQDPALLLETPRGNVEKDQLQYVVGLDKSDLFIRNLFFNLQLLGSHIFDHDPRMVASESQTGMTAYLRYTCLDSKLELWYRFMIIFQDEDQRHHFEMTYKPLPWAQVGIGAVAFDGGGDTTTFGQYADRDFVYAKLKLIFRRHRKKPNICVTLIPSSLRRATFIFR